MRHSILAPALVLCAMVVLLAIAAQSASALSVSPAKIIFDTPGEHAFSIVVRNEGESGTVSIRASGDLAEHVRFTKESEEFAGDVRFEGVIDVPESIEPGDHVQEITVAIQSGTGDLVGVSAEVSTLLIVRKTYPGPYFVIDASAAPDEGLLDTTNLYLSIENRGDQGATPKVTVERKNGSAGIPAAAIPPRGSSQLAAVLHGRGMEDIMIIVEGAQAPVRKEMRVAVGRPVILSLRADAVPEPGSIKPITVAADVDWNAPVAGALRVGTRDYGITITDGRFEQVYYVETESASVPVTLTIGRESVSVDAPLAPGPRGAPVMRSMLRWEYLALVVLLILVPLVLYLLRRQAVSRQ